MNVLKPSLTLSPMRENKSNLLNMNITSKKERRILMTARNKRSELLVNNEIAKNTEKRKKMSKIENEIKTIKKQNLSNSLTFKNIKSKFSISVEKNKKASRNNLSTNNHNFKKRPLNSKNVKLFFHID